MLIQNELERDDYECICSSMTVSLFVCLFGAKMKGTDEPQIRPGLVLRDGHSRKRCRMLQDALFRLADSCSSLCGRRFTFSRHFAGQFEV